LPLADDRPRIEASAVSDAETESPATDLVATADDDTALPVVLVVEDHGDIRRSVLRLLSGCYRVQGAADGTTGLALARRLAPDVVVADVNMPGLDGFAMARRLAADPETEDVPVVFLTARGSADDELEG